MAYDIVRHDYNGHLISQRPEDGYVCLTDMAKVSGKKVANYFELKSTKAYVEGLSLDIGIPTSKLAQVIQGRGDSVDQGTWAHPEIAIDFAKWCSVGFRIWANRTLRTLIEEKETPLVQRVKLSEIREATEFMDWLHGRAYAESYARHQLKAHKPYLIGPEVPATERASLKSAEALLTPTQLASELGLTYASSGKPNPRAVNSLLATLGYQVKIDKKWSATEKGKPFSDRKPVDTNSKSDKDQLLWYASILDELRGNGQEAA